MNMTDIINIIIPDTVSHIGYNAFKEQWYENLNDEFVIAGDKVLIKYNGTERNVEIPKPSNTRLLVHSRIEMIFGILNCMKV